MKLHKKNIGIGAFLAATLGTTVIASAFAALPADQSQTTKTVRKGYGFKQNETETAQHKIEMAQSLATVLGTTVQSITDQLNAGKSPRDIVKASGLDEATIKVKLDASREATVKSRVAADVASGKLTQTQADQMLADMKNHKAGERGNMKDGVMHDEMIAGAASVLGTTKEALKTQVASGKSMKDIVTASGVSESDFRTKMDALHVTSMKTKLAADVSSGKLTQTEADQMITEMQNHKAGEKGGRRGGFGKKVSSETN